MPPTQKTMEAALHGRVRTTQQLLNSSSILPNETAWADRDPAEQLPPLSPSRGAGNSAAPSSTHDESGASDAILDPNPLILELKWFEPALYSASLRPTVIEAFQA